MHKEPKRHRRVAEKGADVATKKMAMALGQRFWAGTTSHWARPCVR